MIFYLALLGGFLNGLWIGAYFTDKKWRKYSQIKNDLITTQLADIEKKIKSSLEHVSKKSFLSGMETYKTGKFNNSFLDDVDQAYSSEVGK